MCMCFKVEAISSRFETVWTKFDTTKELTKDNVKLVTSG